MAGTDSLFLYLVAERLSTFRTILLNPEQIPKRDRLYKQEGPAMRRLAPVPKSLALQCAVVFGQVRRRAVEDKDEGDAE